MATLWTTENLIALLTLTVLEIVLGIDNLVFLSILTGKLPVTQRGSARTVGLSLALLGRVGLLLGITWIMHLTHDLFRVLGQGISTKDLILLAGGLFLVAKATHEIHDRLNPEPEQDPKSMRPASFGSVVSQLVVIDLVFSLDSVITAVGMAQEVAIMIAAVVVAIVIMLVFSGTISNFIERNPTMKVLALSFLILIGVLLIAEGLDHHINRGYVYFAMAFALAVELLHMRIRRVERQARLSTAKRD